MEVIEEIDLHKEVNTKTARFRREFEERWGSLVVGRTHWKMIAGALAAIALVQDFAMWNLAKQSKVDYYVVDRTGGQVNYAGPLRPQNMDDATWDIVRVEEFKKFISYWRTVTTDSVAQAADWDRSFYFLGDGSQARKAVAEWFETNDPFKRAQAGNIVTVQFNSFQKVPGSNTYFLNWTETQTSVGGQPQSSRRWQARIVYAVKLPTNPRVRAENPLGLLITELTYGEEQ